jgi:hypothetical protein
MSSLRRVQSSRANGTLSKGPATPAGKLRSSENAIIHGLCADCIVLEDEERENFLNLLQQHINHFRPVGEVEFGLVEEMCAARWRQRRAWSIETRMFDTQIALPPDGDSLDRMVIAFDAMAAARSLSLLHRYETRLNLTYQRSLRTLIMLRKVKVPNEPSPISEHSSPAVEQSTPSQQPIDSGTVSNEDLGSSKAATAGNCFRLRQPFAAGPSLVAPSTPSGVPAKPPAASPRAQAYGGTA